MTKATSTSMNSWRGSWNGASLQGRKMEAGGVGVGGGVGAASGAAVVGGGSGGDGVVPVGGVGSPQEKKEDREPHPKAPLEKKSSDDLRSQERENREEFKRMMKIGLDYPAFVQYFEKRTCFLCFPQAF
jgi:hypothetical protein